MGLLTDPKQRQRLVNIINNYNQRLCILLYIVGLVWFLALPYQPLNAGTYFSENALLPGLVENEFYAPSDIEEINNQLKEQMEKDDKTTPKDWVYKQFRDLGLDAYDQNFTLKYPFRPMDDKSIQGRNIYAVLRARRSSSTESVVISSPFRPWYSEDRHISGGIAIMLALARHLRGKPYLAKDIIFLLPEFDEVGMQAWLDAYHQTKTEYIFPGSLPGRGGQIQAALNLEIPPQDTAYLNLKLEGINGQLPNLDFVNLVVRLCRKERVKVTLNKMDDYKYEPETFDGYLHSLKTMLNMMWYQSPGSPTGNHGLFHRYHIEALTLSGETSRKGKKISLDKTGRIVEGVFRSLNNLLERFHQSFFFYILPGTQRYISIGVYMPPFALIVVAGLIKALALWIGADSQATKPGQASKDESQEEKTEGKKGKKEEKDKKQQKEKRKKDAKEEMDKFDQKQEEDDEDEDIPPPVGLRSLIPVVSISMLLGFMGYCGPEFLARFSTPFRMRVQDTLLFGLLALFCASLLYPRMIKRKSTDLDKFMVDWQTLKSVALILLSLLLFSVALMNISLAFFLAATMMPICTFIRPTKGRLLTWLQKFLLLLVSPASFIFLAAILHVILIGENYDGILGLLSVAGQYVKHMVLMRLLDQCFFGSWTYTVMSIVVFPSWLMFWAVPHCEAQ